MELSSQCRKVQRVLERLSARPMVNTLAAAALEAVGSVTMISGRVGGCERISSAEREVRDEQHSGIKLTLLEVWSLCTLYLKLVMSSFGIAVLIQLNYYSNCYSVKVSSCSTVPHSILQ